MIYPQGLTGSRISTLSNAASLLCSFRAAPAIPTLSKSPKFQALIDLPIDLHQLLGDASLR
jgi:hypothetical protein